MATVVEELRSLQIRLYSAPQDEFEKDAGSALAVSETIVKALKLCEVRRDLLMDVLLCVVNFSALNGSAAYMLDLDVELLRFLPLHGPVTTVDYLEPLFWSLANVVPVHRSVRDRLTATKVQATIACSFSHLASHLSESQLQPVFRGFSILLEQMFTSYEPQADDVVWMAKALPLVRRMAPTRGPEVNQFEKSCARAYRRAVRCYNVLHKGDAPSSFGDVTASVATGETTVPTSICPRVCEALDVVAEVKPRVAGDSTSAAHLGLVKRFTRAFALSKRLVSKTTVGL
jgi:hypothetical protein